jgi:plastocyanin
MGMQRMLLTLRCAGAGLLAATAGIHLDLYLTGYRHLPTIGWLFLLQVIAGCALAAAVLALRRPLADAAGAGFALSTLGGYLLSLWIGLFGFHEIRTTAGLVAGLIEVAAFALLGLAALASLPSGGPLAAALARLRPRLPGGARAVLASAAVAALVVLAVSVGTAGSASSSGSTVTAAGSGPVVKIIIRNFMFRPTNPDVRPGERIEVTNEDSVTHTLTAGPARHQNLFSTGDVGPGQTRVISAPRQAGMYPFYCTIHPWMIGVLIVGK